MAVLEVTSKLGKILRLDEERRKHVREHPEMENQMDRLRATILDPDEVRKSDYDDSVWLFYKFYKYLLVEVSARHR